MNKDKYVIVQCRIICEDKTKPFWSNERKYVWMQDSVKPSSYGKATKLYSGIRRLMGDYE